MIDLEYQPPLGTLRVGHAVLKWRFGFGADIRRELNSIKRDAWMSDELREKLRNLHRAWHKIRSKADRIDYRKENKKLKKAIKSAQLQFEKELGERAKKDPKLIHCYIRNKIEVKEQIRVLKDKEGGLWPTVRKSRKC